MNTDQVMQSLDPAKRYTIGQLRALNEGISFDQLECALVTLVQKEKIVACPGKGEVLYRVAMMEN